MEDVLEEIVGEIEDEFSRVREDEFSRHEDGAAYISAGLSAEYVEDLFGVNIESDDFDTVGGFVYHHLGRVRRSATWLRKRACAWKWCPWQEEG